MFHLGHVVATVLHELLLLVQRHGIVLGLSSRSPFVRECRLVGSILGAAGTRWLRNHTVEGSLWSFAA